MNDFQYVGDELEIFALAKNWKSYVRSKIGLYLIGDVLEVGAGLGATAELFNDGSQARWVCLEPDPELAKQIPQRMANRIQNTEILAGTLADLNAAERFDAILYMDVLEHIEDDKAEVAQASQFLKSGGALVILSPAFPWLYSPFDKAIGHFRRYTKATLRAAMPSGLRQESLRYLDSVGMLTSAANKALLHSATPSKNQIRFWDRVLIPLSRIVDPVVGFSFGRSVVGVWRKVS